MLDTDFTSLDKTRKTLLSVAITVFLLSNLHFVSTEFALLGLQISFEQARLVALGQIATALLLLKFTGQALPMFAELVFDILHDRQLATHMKNTKRWETDWETPVTEYDHSPAGERADIDRENKYRTNLIQQKRLATQKLLDRIIMLLLDFLLPAAIAAFAICAPDTVSDFIDQISASRLENANDTP